jgi:hypothetical protein
MPMNFLSHATPSSQLAINIQHCPMQCVLRRWNVHTIGRNATESNITLAVLPQRSFHTIPARWTRGDYGTPTSSTLRGLRKGSSSASKGDPPPKPSRARAKSHTIVAKPEDQASKTEPEQWQTQKSALKEKFGDESWSPRKKLSPDTIDAIRAMHASDPERFNTPVLAENFKISPEAIRRILKSKWQPKPEEQEDRRQRWEKRGERVWSQLSEMGVKPPKPWRVRGVGKVSTGDTPAWKGRSSGRGRAGTSVASAREATTVRRGLVAAKASHASPSSGIGAGKRISDRML